ncbi:MAG: NADH-quinone oxidoreductase subunit NuoF [Spirochaetaceae bacterium]
MSLNNLEQIKLETLENVQFLEVKKHELEVRRVLRNCDVIDPLNINEYIARDGYFAAYKAINTMTPDVIIKEMKKSGLRGRGGGGFPTGIKWEIANKIDSNQKYIICNADEGDPGAFMDRSILEKDPHSVIEGMLIAGYSIGASIGYIYIRAEYPTAAEHLNLAIKAAKKLKYLGNNVFDSTFNFDIEIRLGAGAFVCGEETALIASIEGERGMPRLKPPFPAIKGLFGKPTVINNVETLSNIPQIIFNGSHWFLEYGTENSPGTKVFALAGKIVNGGLIEVPMGISLQKVIYDIGGGVEKNRKFKAVLTGGPSGGCLTTIHLEEQIDFDNLKSLGSMMGSGGMIVLDDTNCMVDIAGFYMDFMVDESCGKCTPCREGTKRMSGILQKIISGSGNEHDFIKLNQLANTVKNTSLCGLGKTAPNPVLSTIQYFNDEYLDHINNRHCEAGVCEDLSKYNITSKCIGCQKCSKNCPVDCISGGNKEQHNIDQETCIKCGICLKVCPISAIEVE